LEACLLHLTEALLQGVKDYSSETQTIVMILSVLTSIGLLGMQYWYWLPLVENLRAKISKDRRVLNVIPFDWIMNDEKLYTQFDKLNI